MKYFGAGIAIASTYAFAAYLLELATTPKPGGSGEEGLFPGLLSFGLAILAARSTWRLVEAVRESSKIEQ